MTQIIFKKDNSTLFANSMDEVENVGFRDYMVTFHAKSIYSVLQKLVPPFLKKTVEKKAIEIAIKNFESEATNEIPAKLNKILDTPMTKKDQIKLLKGVQLFKNQLFALFALAETKGYSFSHYRYKGDPRSVRKEDLPLFINAKQDGPVEYFGDTPLTDGQMRQVVEQADVIIARILDNGEHWHCFLQTFKGLKGKEHGEHGSRPHIHYLSDSFGISRKELVDMIHNGRYPKTPIHIPLV